MKLSITRQLQSACPLVYRRTDDGRTSYGERRRAPDGLTSGAAGRPAVQRVNRCRAVTACQRSYEAHALSGEKTDEQLRRLVNPVCADRAADGGAAKRDRGGDRGAPPALARLDRRALQQTPYAQLEQRPLVQRAPHGGADSGMRRGRLQSRDFHER